MRRLAALVLCLPLAAAAGNPPASAIASAHPLATEAGRQVLAQGGNAFDAAIAVAAVLGVVEPYSAGLGGGGFWLLHRADGQEIVVDARERAPLAATPDMYLGDNGEPDPAASLTGARAAAIPGQPAAFAHIAAQYGRLPLSASLAPAIALAEDGFSVTPRYRSQAAMRLADLTRDDRTAEIFLHEYDVPPLHHRIRQPALARTLSELAAKGADGFYRGETAERLVAAVRAAGGIWQRGDLRQYRVIERAPLKLDFGRMRLTTVPPPGGGLVVAETLALLDVPRWLKLASPQREQQLIEAMRLAYRDRAQYLGDPAFAKIDVEQLLAPARIAALRREMPRGRAGVSAPLPRAGDGRDTTHLSVLDAEGNRVSATLSINGPFGAAFVAGETGVLLNNEMDDFVAKPGSPNLYGLVGSAANAIAPGKRPQSSMSPSFIEDDGRVLIVGTPGGSRIISMLTQTALAFAQGGAAIKTWLHQPRFHHQYLPDVVEHEPLALASVRKTLVARGYALKAVARPYGNMQGVLWLKAGGRVLAASDPRGEGAAIVIPSDAPKRKRRAP